MGRRNQKPFLVVRSYSENKELTGGEKFSVWEKVTAKKYSVRVGRKSLAFVAIKSKLEQDKARKLIEEYGLVDVLTNEHGTIYDTPDKAFQKAYEGRIYT